jgi:DNA-directed RNA polymerase subunit omega
MMLYPPVAELARKAGSRYQLVNLVARRARAIAAEADEAGEPLDQKPVSQAIDEVYAGKLVIVHNHEADEAQTETAAEEEAE